MLKACHNARFHGKGIGYYQKKKIIKSSQTMSADNQSITGTTLQNYFW